METLKASLFLRAAEVWLLISVAETLHGVARISLLQPIVGDFQARQIAVVTGSLIILAIAVLFRDWIPITAKPAAATVGLLWVGFTIAFEVILGRLIMGLSWARILEDYNIADGGLMVLGLLVMFAAPFIALWYRRRSERHLIADGQTAA